MFDTEGTAASRPGAWRRRRPPPHWEALDDRFEAARRHAEEGAEKPGHHVRRGREAARALRGEREAALLGAPLHARPARRVLPRARHRFLRTRAARAR